VELNPFKKYYQFSRLQDMLDFSRVIFDVSIKTNITKKTVIQSKYPLIELSNFEVQK
jgi:hypothetical protein